VPLDAAQWRARLSGARYDSARWAANTQDLVANARSKVAQEIRDDYPRYPYWVEEISAHPELLEPDLLSSFFTEFGRLAANLGRPAGSIDVEQALDRAIAVQRRLGGSVCQLYLAKAAYLGSQTTESEARLTAIRCAIREASRPSEAWADAMIALAQYQGLVSRYDEAVRTVRVLSDELPGDLFQGRYRCAALVQEGMALFASFQDMSRAQRVFRAAAGYAGAAGNDLQIARWVATAYHFLARIADVGRRYPEAVALYLRGQEFQARCPEEVEANLFFHLRLAESLMAAGVMGDARDHLEEAFRLARTGSNTSYARLQVELGFATFAASTGDLVKAQGIAEAALASARAVAFWRGELLGLGYLLVLAIRRRRPDKILGAAARIARTALFGELRRNKLTKLVLRIPVVLPIAVRRMSGRARLGGGGAAEPVYACPCAYLPHRRGGVDAGEGREAQRAAGHAPGRE
jgi:tetratricopeptide (TPR) repeat protein